MSVKSMALSAKKISARQAVALVLILTLAMDFRVLPLFATQPAGFAGWLAVVVQYACLLIFFHIIYRFLMSFPGQSFAQIAQNIWGKVLGRLAVFFYILWLLLILCFNTHMFSVRLTHAQYPEQSQSILIGIFILFAVIILRTGIVPIARMTRLCLFFLVTLFVILILMWFPSYRLENFIPVTYLDLGNVGISSLKVLYTGAFSILLLMLGDKIAHHNTIRRISFRGVTVLSAVKLCIVLAALGILGPRLIPKIPFAMNTMINSIAFSSSLERIDSFLAVLFTLADFMFICIVSFCLLQLLQTLFSLHSTTPLLALLGLSLFFGSSYLSGSFMALVRLEEIVIYPLSMVMGFGLPLLLFVTGKMRRLIS